ncbi:MAG TPA: AAA family ATPase [Acidimicrobiales bacterium]|nr:AAA family ATPase [Acidimicrobiales bacterium]
MDIAPMLVVATGLPGSGKTTLAAQLAEALALPLIAKDHFKEILFETLGVRDADWSRQIGRAAIALQYDAMRTHRSAVVDSALWTGLSEPEIEAFGLPLVQVYCRCPFEVARARYFERISVGERHVGHRDDEMTDADYEKFRPLLEPLALAAPLVEVDTTTPVDIAATVAAIRAAASLAAAAGAT